ncbi:MAG: hypothetical protein ACREOM_00665 [Candidatus Dormibacteraceae bacterium]
MELGAGFFLAAGAVAGFGITYLSGVALNLEERIAFGTVLGAMIAAASTFLISLAVRDVTATTDLIGLATTMAIGVAGIVIGRPLVAADFADARRRWITSPRTAGHPWPVAAVVLVCGAWTVHFLHQAYVYTPAGLFAGYVNIWGDWAAHLSFAGSFAYGQNFPPEYSIDPGHHLGYPFMIDFLAADLVPLGLSLTSALVATTATLTLALPGVLYIAALRFAGGRVAAVIAVFVFLLSGGLGFVYLAGDIHTGGFGVLLHLPREYTLNRDLNFQWLNPVLAYLIPQRSTLFGFSLALILLVVIWVAVRDGLGWQPFLFAGVAAGMTPVFHVHAYGTVLALSAFWAAFHRRREWLAFFLPALVIGVPILVWMWPPANTSLCGDLPSIHGYCIQPGWLAFADFRRDGAAWIGWDFVWFWIKNTSVFIPLLIAAYAVRRWFPTDFPKWYAPMWLWFIVPNLVLLQPWDWDNTKFFIFWMLFGSVLVGGVLAGMLQRRGVAAVGACVLLVLLGLSGALDLSRAADFSTSAVQFTDAGGLQVAAWVRQNTSPTAMFVVADEHNNPIPTLAGRRILVGYPGWLWTYGLPDYAQKGADATVILDGAPTTQDLVRKYRVDYVMIGPQELTRGASRSYWDAHGRLVYNTGEYAVYRVNR